MKFSFVHVKFLEHNLKITHHYYVIVDEQLCLGYTECSTLTVL